MTPEVLALAERVAGLMRASEATIAIAESSSGGLIAAALLAMPGASAYFRGGAVVYTLDAKAQFLGLPREALTEPRAATEAHAAVLAHGVRDRLGTTWGVGETGAAGPTGNRYGDRAGHTCIAIDGPRPRTITVETGHPARAENMRAFALAALRLLEEAIAAQ